MTPMTATLSLAALSLLAGYANAAGSYAIAYYNSNDCNGEPFAYVVTRNPEGTCANSGSVCLRQPFSGPFGNGREFATKSYCSTSGDLAFPESARNRDFVMTKLYTDNFEASGNATCSGNPLSITAFAANTCFGGDSNAEKIACNGNQITTTSFSNGQCSGEGSSTTEEGNCAQKCEKPSSFMAGTSGSNALTASFAGLAAASLVLSAAFF